MFAGTKSRGDDARVRRQDVGKRCESRAPGCGGYSQPFSRLSDTCPAPCDKWIIFVAYCNFLRTAPWAVSRRRCTEGILMPDFVLGRLTVDGASCDVCANWHTLSSLSSFSSSSLSSWSSLICGHARFLYFILYSFFLFISFYLSLSVSVCLSLSLSLSLSLPPISFNFFWTDMTNSMSSCDQLEISSQPW